MNATQKPVQMHVVHDLGGGVERWYQDFCSADATRTNLVLKPFLFDESNGAGLMLFRAANDMEPIRFWPFRRPIKTITTTHDEYREAIDQILQEFAIDAIIVSSLIGHSLDILGTGLPTIFITHDYFPFCPAINAYFNGPCNDCDDQRLAECACSNPVEFNPFPDLSVSDRIRIRQGFLEHLRHHQTILVSPTSVTRRRWRDLMPDFAEREIGVIPHGQSVAWSPIENAPRSGTNRLRLLVLGLLTAPKGFHLLEQALEELTSRVEVLMVGVGVLGRLLAEKPGVTIVDSYELERLPGLLTELQPDLALLSSVCPETFSYSLSELTAMGIPVLAANVGAFSERIRDDETGFLFEPTPNSLIKRLEEVNRNRALLATVRARLLTLSQRTAEEMVADYHRLLPPRSTGEVVLPTYSEDAISRWVRHIVPAVAKAWRTQHRLRQGIEIQEQLLSYRQEEVARLEGTNIRLLDRDAELTRQVAEQNETISSLRRQLQEVDRRLKERLEALAATEHRLDAILNSTSWTVTRPLRVMSMIARGRHQQLLAGLRRHLLPWGRRVYWRLPLQWRAPLVGLAYRVAGSLFEGLPDYQRWQASRVTLGNANLGADMVDIESVLPCSAPPTGAIAIHVHLFYGDLANEFAEYLRQMPYAYDVYVSVPDASVRDMATRILSNLPHQERSIVAIVPNRGRDIAPMFCTFGAELQAYEYVAHIHTKKSLYNDGRTTGWREYLLDGLLGSPDQVRRVFSLLTGSGNFGVVYPQTYFNVPYQAHTWLANRVEGEALARRTGVSQVPVGYFDFPVGSMFWAKTEALQPLFKLGLTLNDFPVEYGQTDGTLAHSLERLLGVVPRGMGWALAILRDRSQSSWSRWRVDQFFRNTEDGLFKRLAAADVDLVVFDIFDTLLTRPMLDPEHVKEIVAARLGGEVGRRYLTERALVEQQARGRAGRDVTLDDIYREWLTTSSLSREQLAAARAMEEIVEQASVSGRMHVIAILRRLAAAGKRVVLASDTYLPSTLIDAMFAANDVTGWKRMYLSGEVGFRKDNGTLYRHLLAEEDVVPGAVIMVGDNERSDFQIPADIGLRFSHLLRPVEIARTLPRWQELVEVVSARHNLNWSIGLGSIVRHQFSDLFYPQLSPASMVSSARAMGYSVVGPLAAAFSQWLARQSRDDGIDHLYFLAREGQFLLRIYEMIRRVTGEGPAASYLVVSRRAVTVPMIEAGSDIHELARTRFFPNDLEMFLRERYGLTVASEELAEIHRRELWPRGQPVEVRDRAVNHLVPLLDFLGPAIIAQARLERPALLEYLRSVGLQSEIRAAVVDVGYSATIQSRLNRLLKRQIGGYYMVANKAAKAVGQTDQVIVKGCFGDGIAPESNSLRLYRHSFEIEKLLSSDENQVLNYRLESEKDGTTMAIPCLREFKIGDQGTQSLRAEIQAGALAFVDGMLRIKTDLCPGFVFPPELASQLFDALMTGTSLEEADILRGIVLDDYYCGRGLVA